MSDKTVIEINNGPSKEEVEEIIFGVLEKYKDKKPKNESTEEPKKMLLCECKK